MVAWLTILIRNGSFFVGIYSLCLCYRRTTNPLLPQYPLLSDQLVMQHTGFRCFFVGLLFLSGLGVDRFLRGLASTESSKVELNNLTAPEPEFVLYTPFNVAYTSNLLSKDASCNTVIHPSIKWYKSGEFGATEQ